MAQKEILYYRNYIIDIVARSGTRWIVHVYDPILPLKASRIGALTTSSPTDFVYLLQEAQAIIDGHLESKVVHDRRFVGLNIGGRLQTPELHGRKD